jgi:protease-4
MSDSIDGSRGPAPTATPFTPGPAAAPAAPTPEAPRRSRTWIWVTVSTVVVVLLIAGSCGLATWSLVSSGDGMPTGGDAVAVIYLDGQIAGVDSSGLGGGGYVTPERVIDELKRAEKDPAVKAIILRIDSPGGTASASWEIAIQVQRATKPVIASIGDVGASGAYMIASQCDEIISTGSSGVGSIGVIMEVGDYSALLDKLGVKFISIHEGEFKDAGAPWRSLTASETAMLKDDIKIVYDDFISSVAKGRKMSEPDVRKLATGWAWPGKKAKDLGLVDTLGNYSDAVARAGKLGKIEGRPRVVTYRDESLGALIQQLTSSLDRLGGAAVSGPDLLPARPALR